MTDPANELGGVVPIPADLDRPDRILLGLSARQLAVLAGAGLVGWLAVGLAGRLAGPGVGVVVAVPLGLAGLGLALGWRDGVPLDRLVWAALGWWRRPRRRVVAPDGLAAAPAWAGPPGPRLAAVAGPIGSLDPSGVLELAGAGWALVCAATPVNLKLRTGAEQQQLLAGFARLLHALTGPVQLLVSNHPADLTGRAGRLRQQAASLPDPGLERAALAYAGWLEGLADPGPQQLQLRRRQLLVIFQLPPGTPDPGATLARQATQAAGLLAAVGVTLTPLDHDQVARVLAAATNPDRPPRPGGLAPAEAVIRGGHP
jgi:hypothetical protein